VSTSVDIRPASSAYNEWVMGSSETMAEIAAMRRVVSDCFKPRMAIYFADVTITMLVVLASYGGAILLPLFSPMQIVSFLVAGPAVYRVGSFVHEIVHMRRGEHVAFKVYWHLIAGIPMFLPTYMYENHIGHHNTHDYGTRQDAEYLPFGASPIGLTILYTLQVLLIPVLAVFRFGVLVPISMVCPPVRRWMLARFSAYGIHFYYRREPSSGEPHALWMLIDVLVFIRLVAPVALCSMGILPWKVLGILYVLSVYALTLNWIRGLAAHRYRGDGQPMGLDEQFEDSVNLTGDPVLTEIICPLGLRFHALHHLFPSIPYHRLGEAHRKLMNELPEDSVYRKTLASGLWSVLADLYRSARSSSATTLQSWKQA